MTKIILKIRGGSPYSMCPRRISIALKGVAGVTDANMDLKTGLAVVTYEGDVKEDDLIMSVVNIGLRAEVKRE
ncbi:MAG: heavy metal-associated domain-containing protein [Candidatus Methanomethylophilaceae archaeon]|jgi:copper chaperone CopZ